MSDQRENLYKSVSVKMYLSIRENDYVREYMLKSRENERECAGIYKNE